MTSIEALALDDPTMMLREAVEHQLTAHHRSRAELLGELRALRDRYHEREQPELEDAVLDVMDMLDGWTGPSGRL